MHKKTLFINLNKLSYEIKSLTNLRDYIGGVGTGLKLLYDYIKDDPLIFSVGPLNGFFPFASKTSIVFHNLGAVEDLYLGGSLSYRIRFAGFDNIIFSGEANENIIIDIQDEEVKFLDPMKTDIKNLGLPGKRSVLSKFKDKFVLDDYFITPKNFLESKMSSKKIEGVVISGSNNFELLDRDKYKELYLRILDRKSEVSVEPGDNSSCSGCPLGCIKSQIGEIGGNVLVHSLVGCSFADKIYSDIGITFSCLNILGYDYTHEDLENLPYLVKEILKELS